MYNTDLPQRSELPTSSQLRRSTLIAGIAASVILAFVVLPSEYAIDPTGVGRMLGLTQMGEIKMKLAEEAAQDATKGAAAPVAAPAPVAGAAPGATPAPVVAPAPVAEAAPVASPAPLVAEEQAATPQWQDEVSFTLAPDEGAEFKLAMEQGAQVEFSWTANGGVVNYDKHGDGGGNSVSYEKGRGVGEQEGVLEAAFTGNHGWFWRNRGSEPLTMTLRTRGAYSKLKRMM